MLICEIAGGVSYHPLYHTVRIQDVHRAVAGWANGGPLIGHTTVTLNDYTDWDMYDEPEGVEVDYNKNPERFGTPTRGTSFTRDWRMHIDTGSFGNVTFQVDRRIIAHNNKIAPHDDLWKDDPHYKKSEREEFVIGDIKHFARAITHVYTALDTTSGAQDDDAQDTKKSQEALMLLFRKYPNIKHVVEKKNYRDNRHETGNRSVEIHTIQYQKLIKLLPANEDEWSINTHFRMSGYTKSLKDAKATKTKAAYVALDHAGQLAIDQVTRETSNSVSPTKPAG